MNAIYREVAIHQTETILLVMCLFFITAAKNIHASKFRYFTVIFLSTKYLKIYSREQTLYYNWFNLFLFVTQLISFGLFLKITAVYFNLALTLNVFLIIVSIAAFIFLKFFTERMIAVLFNMEKFITQYHFYKLSYRNFIGIAMLPFIGLIIYSPISKSFMAYTIVILFGVLNIAAMVITLKSYQKLIFTHPFYFILYFCTFEIAPYLIVAKLLLH